MASNLQAFLKGKRTKHVVGQVNSYEMDTIINGAVCSEDLDNFTMGEIEYKKNEATGEVEAHVKKATATTPVGKAVLLVTPERRLDIAGIKELLCDFYNEKGERATCATLPMNFSFQTSAFDASAVTGKKAEAGQYASWDGEKFVLADAESEEATKTFIVAEVESNFEYSIDDSELVMLTVIK